MLIKTAAAAMLLTIAAAPGWAINKCTGPDGAVVYQEQSCALSTKAEVIKAPGRPLADYELKEREAVSKAKLVCKMEEIPFYPSIGWDEAKFMSCSRIALLRSPDAVNVTEHASGQSKQFVYRYDGAYIYTRNGLVSTIQKSR